MIRAELAMLDIGATLVDGPAKAPASRIAARLQLDRAQKAALSVALMTTPFAVPDDAVAVVRAVSGLPSDVVDAAVAEIWTAQEHEAQPLPGGACQAR